jgi:hypothetical protein
MLTTPGLAADSALADRLVALLCFDKGPRAAGAFITHRLSRSVCPRVSKMLPHE